LKVSWQLPLGTPPNKRLQIGIVFITIKAYTYILIIAGQLHTCARSPKNTPAQHSRCCLRCSKASIRLTDLFHSFQAKASDCLPQLASLIHFTGAERAYACTLSKFLIFFCTWTRRTVKQVQGSLLEALVDKAPQVFIDNDQ
jgi:hypothetical protein